MSFSTATAAYSAVCITGCISLPSPKNRAFPSTFSPLYTRRQSPSLLVVVTSAADDSNEVAGTATSSEDEVRQDLIEEPVIIPSLFATLNVERALRGIGNINEVDHYARLGLPRRCPYDQVDSTYDAVTELNGQGLNKDELEENLKLLKESYAVLSSVKERKLYDWSLARSANPNRYIWPFKPDITQTPTQPPPPPELEDVGPTRLVGYCFLSWVLLSWVLSITLNH